MPVYEWSDLLYSTRLPGFRLGALYGLTIAAYLGYWFPVEHEGVKAWFQKRYETRWQRRLFVANKVWGSVLFSVVLSATLVLFPGFRLLSAVLTVNAEHRIATLIWILTLLPFAVLVTGLQNRTLLKSRRRPTRYPELGADGWSGRTVALHGAFWSLYLTVYEILFRGVLLGIPAALIGPWPAVGINAALYSAVHMPKGGQEAFGALLLGTLLCLVTLTTGNAYTAIVVHIALAVSNGLWAKRVHRLMSDERVG